MEWQPIETAPKGGIRFLVWDKVYKNIGLAYWGHGDMPRDSGVHNGYPLPTHWMPLPEPPKK